MPSAKAALGKLEREHTELAARRLKVRQEADKLDLLLSRLDARKFILRSEIDEKLISVAPHDWPELELGTDIAIAVLRGLATESFTGTGLLTSHGGRERGVTINNSNHITLVNFKGQPIIPAANIRLYVWKHA